MVPPGHYNCPPLPVHEMMRRLGIESAGGVIPQYGLAFSCVERNCRDCQDPERCRKWLGDASLTMRLAPDFCPNAGLLLPLMLDGPVTEPLPPAQTATCKIP